MTPRDFCYWLQGWMELSEMKLELSDRQIACIKKHLLLVEETVSLLEAKELGEAHSFIRWLADSMALIEIASDRQRSMIWDKVVEKLEQVFIHDIDPSPSPDAPPASEEVQSQLNNIHNAGLDRPPTYRC